MHRPLPACPEAERELLGWDRQSARPKRRAFDGARDDFADLKHAKIYEAIAELGKQRQTIDPGWLPRKCARWGWRSTWARWVVMHTSPDWSQSAAIWARTMQALTQSRARRRAPPRCDTGICAACRKGIQR